MRRHLALSAGLCFLALALGCSHGPIYELNEQVGGTLTLDGVPLVNVHVQFVPQTATTKLNEQCPMSGGHTDEKGHFELSCEDGKPGAVIGKQRVVVLAGRTDPADRDGASSPIARAAKKNPPIPSVFMIASQSPYNLEVTKDKHDYDVKLSSNLTKPQGGQ